MKNKYIKFLIILNGTLLPLILVFLLFQITKDLFKSKDNYRNEGVIVGEVLEEAKTRAHRKLGKELEPKPALFQSAFEKASPKSPNTGPNDRNFTDNRHENSRQKTMIS